MKCKICDGTSEIAFTHLVLSKYEVKYFRCNDCGFLQTEEAYWIEEAYNNALNIDDTGLIKRNEYFREKVSVLLYFLFQKENTFIDFAGGYGIFTRMMRDIGFDYYWVDKYAKNLVSRGFEHQLGKRYEALTAFEVFEHLENPLAEVEEMFKYSDTIIFSTVMLPQQLPDTNNWWYYAFHHGQHIAFYTQRSMQKLAEKFGANFYTNGTNFHMLSKRNLNQGTFKSLVKLSKYGLYHFVKATMISKTDSDSALLIRK
jgi:2-polyprenyl-3-methyl-5-hydroxy-6-metoxy-1,4-benzoquinol methylase